MAGFGQANERIARTQDSYASNASSTWLASVERSLAHMREYQVRHRLQTREIWANNLQNARKKLESRRLAYDTSMSKMQRSKREDFRAEEEHRQQKIKYEESAEDVQRRMQDIIEAENDNVADLYTFLEAELDYHDRCREMLLQVKQNWPLVYVRCVPGRVSSLMPHSSPPSLTNARPAVRSRTNTLTRITTNPTIEEEYLDPRPRIRSRATSNANSPRHELPGYDFSPVRASPSRSYLSESARPMITRTTTEPQNLRLPVRTTPQQRRVSERGGPVDVFGDNVDNDATSSSPERDYGTERSDSPATSYAPSISRHASFSTLGENDRGGLGNKKAPPPPPSRSTKPKAPPPPPMKRSALSQSNVLQSYT